MKTSWVYTLMFAAVVGMVIAAGSAATAEAGKIPAAAAAPSPAPGPEGTAPVIWSDTSSSPNFVWFAGTNGADAPTTVYAVPAGKKLKIDDVIIASGSGVTGTNLMFRGAAGTTIFMYVGLPGGGHFEHSYQNLILNSGEILRVQTTITGSGAWWTITAHYV